MKNVALVIVLTVVALFTVGITTSYQHKRALKQVKEACLYGSNQTQNQLIVDLNDALSVMGLALTPVETFPEDVCSEYMKGK